ncbi:hypothetical protein B296_00050732 [Ensete ventricosum]|uniref:Uncharacterized protein n=1 Tax=Ensete ventricosum TaxID=4639 RepID=A0A426YAN1_ENSVE|nr:hypothetical protein B296_00050732 [Ensete ventricosum]
MLEGSPLPRAQWPAGGEVSPSTSGSSWSDLGWSSGRSFSCFPPCFSFPTSPLLFSPEATRVKAHGQRAKGGLESLGHACSARKQEG